MANNVDLLVVGATEGLTAVELTERLVAEFKQPAEAFAELVAAACDGGPKYAAQSGVTLDTAVEGQGKLEDLGVVCELLVDGKPVPSSGLSNPTPEQADAKQADAEQADADQSATNAAETSVDVDVVADDTVDAASEADAAEDATPDIATAEAAPEAESDATDEDFGDLSFDETTDSADAPDADKAETTDAAAEQLPADDGLSFEDELGELGSAEIATESTAKSSEDAEGLESVEINFNDELDSLDDLQSTPAAEPEVNETPATETEAPASEPEVTEAPEATAAVDTDSAELTLDSDLTASAKAQPAKEKSKASDIPAVAKKSSDAPLELSLADDDAGPLTKPKKKSDAAPDDGGLTLVLDDNANSEPAAQSAAKQPEEKQEEKPEPSEALELDVDSGDEEALELRDTSREPVEITPPVAAPEEEAEPETAPGTKTADEALSADSAPEQSAPEQSIPEQPAPEQQDTEVAAAAESSVADDTAASDDSTVSTEEPEPAKADDITSFIASLAGDAESSSTTTGAAVAGGLVMPGQEQSDNEVEAAVTPSPAEASEPSVEDELQAAVSSVAETPALSDVVDLGKAEDLVPDILEDDSNAGAGKKKILAMAAAGLGVVGVGALVALQSGLLSKPVEPATTVVAVAPVKDKSAEFDAVEQVSLNAAIERAEVLKNPDKYTTEELIVYLAEDLGENAKNELKNYVTGGADYKSSSQAAVPRMGAAIPADSDSELWLRNRVDHPADEFFDDWSKREVDLQAYLELQDRLIEVGDLEIALDVSKNTKDKLFAVMSQQRLARAYHALGNSDKASEVLAMAVRGTYAIKLESERVLAIGDYALTEQALGLDEDAEDSFLKASILSRSLHKPQNRTVAFSAIAEYFHKARRSSEALEFLDLAMTTAYELPVNTAARDLAIRHVALTEVRLGLTEQATEHANLIVDPFAAVSALHGIALELERTGDEENARLTLNMAYRAGSLIKNSDKREKLLEKIRLAGN